MNIRKATTADISTAAEIYEAAKNFMHTHGNPTQWVGGYPSTQVIEDDISKDRLYICEDNDIILGVFCYFEGEDPTYRTIYNGAWLNDAPYGVIHRIAMSDAARGCGVSAYCFNYCLEKCGNLKIDTHRDNLPMQKALSKNGFTKCGIIYLENGDERIAFQRLKQSVI